MWEISSLELFSLNLARMIVLPIVLYVAVIILLTNGKFSLDQWMATLKN